MSWIDRELKKRSKSGRGGALRSQSTIVDGARVQDLWRRFEHANQTLPDELQLHAEPSVAFVQGPDDVQFLSWLRAPNGAALGFATNAIRYAWPKGGGRRSNNFWIRWDAAQHAYIVSQRNGAASPPAYAEYKFDEQSVSPMVKCLVQGKRIKAKSIRRKRFWLF